MGMAVITAVYVAVGGSDDDDVHDNIFKIILGY